MLQTAQRSAKSKTKKAAPPHERFLEAFRWMLLVRTLEDTVRLSELRYRGGLDSYLQVLDAQRNLFAGQLSLAQLRLQERVSVVQLYRALGGGWS